MQISVEDARVCAVALKDAMAYWTNRAIDHDTRATDCATSGAMLGLELHTRCATQARTLVAEMHATWKRVQAMVDVST
jgi:hypothetical protein